MTATVPEIVKAGPIVLTPAEYDALSPNPRLELVDGVLRVMTPATGRHQDIVKLLERALEGACPEDLRVVREQELRIADDHRRNPDLMIIRASAYNPDGYSYRPVDVVLAVEVVSPGTETIDRLHKPAEYAIAGAPHYWRVTSRPEFGVFTYRLADTKTYMHTGTFGPGDGLAPPGLPWTKSIEVDDFSA
jgi:Uma2 family endonuclease